MEAWNNKSLRGVIVRLFVFGLDVSDFELYSRYSIHFRKYTSARC